MESDYSLRFLDRNDLPWFLRVRNSSRHFLHDNRHFTERDVLEWWTAGQSKNYKIIEFCNIAVGYFRVGEIEKREEFDLLWIGCDIDPNFRRMGHGYNSYVSMMPIFLNEFNIHGFLLRVLPHNVPAMTLYRRLGFVTSRLTYAPGFGESGSILTDIEMTWKPEALPTDMLDLSLPSRAEGFVS